MKASRWMMAVTIATASAFVSSALLAETGPCDQRHKVVKHLANKYQEVPVAVGVTSSGGLVEVLTTTDGQTWTIILSSPDGTSCLIAAGEGWRKIEIDAAELDPAV